MRRALNAKPLAPDAHALECYRNEARTFVLAGGASRDQVMDSPDFAGLTVDLGVLWR